MNKTSIINFLCDIDISGFNQEPPFQKY